MHPVAAGGDGNECGDHNDGYSNGGGDDEKIHGPLYPPSPAANGEQKVVRWLTHVA